MYQIKLSDRFIILQYLQYLILQIRLCLMDLVDSIWTLDITFAGHVFNLCPAEPS